MQQEKIYVAGHRGMVGSAIVRQLQARGHTNIITRTHAELDLTDQAAVREFFATEKPTQVYLAAAKVGGIHANNTYPADFIYQNLLIEANIIDAAYRNGVQKLLFLGSSCIYPKLAAQPMREDALLTGTLEPTNEPYAIAKIAGIKLCESYNRQYGTDYRSVMPTNLYGPGDNYHLANSHVLPAMIRKFHLAKLAMEGDLAGIIANEEKYGEIPADIKAMIGLEMSPSPLAHSSARLRRLPHAGEGDGSAPSPLGERAGSNSPLPLGRGVGGEGTGAKLTPRDTVTLWGTGTPYREFLHVDDMAAASIYVMNLDKATYAANTQPMCSHINVGYGSDVTIRQVAELVAKVVGYTGSIEFDATKPDGAPRKLMDSSRLNALGWKAAVELEAGIASAYKAYLA